MEECVRNEAGQTLQEFLAAYDANKYRHPSVTLDIAVFSLMRAAEDWALSLLLIRRKDHPNIGKWALPGGFLEMEEELEAAASRELYEETGIMGLPLRQFGAFGKVDRDPRTRIITIGQYAIAPYGALSPQAGDDAAEAAQFKVTCARHAFTSAATLYTLTLNGPCALSARISCREGALGENPVLLPGSTLASDHGLLIYTALRTLYEQDRAKVAALLAGRHAHLLRPALYALEHACCR